MGYLIKAEIFLGAVLVVNAGDICYYNSYTNSGQSQINSKYCSEGCCGYYNERTCCTSLGAIIGAAVGMLICLGVAAGIIVYFCASCKKKTDKATVVNPATDTKLKSKEAAPNGAVDTNPLSATMQEKQIPLVTLHPAPSAVEPLIPGQTTNQVYTGHYSHADLNDQTYPYSQQSKVIPNGNGNQTNLHDQHSSYGKNNSSSGKESAYQQPIGYSNSYGKQNSSYKQNFYQQPGVQNNFDGQKRAYHQQAFYGDLMSPPSYYQ